jgi:hypothetical protein
MWVSSENYAIAIEGDRLVKAKVVKDEYPLCHE